MIKPHIYIIALAITFFSCKKEKLEYDGLKFVGKWKWTYTSVNNNFLCIENHFASEEGSFYSVLDPSTENVNYGLEFLEKGKVVFYKENNVVQEKKILWEMHEASVNKYFFEFYFDKAVQLEGILNGDTLMENRMFPFADNSCDDYTNFFVRE